MRKVTNSPPPTITSPKAPTGPQTPITQATTSVEDPFKNGKSDAFNLKDAELNTLLKELQGDAATLEKVPQAVDKLVTIFGTARSKPVPGENGYPDYAWGEDLGEKLRQAGYSISTGGGPGAMEAPLRGHANQDAQLDMKAGKSTIGWEAGEPNREGANIILPNEQGANPFIAKDHLSSFKRFLFRMEFLFRDQVRPQDHQELKAKGVGHTSPKMGTPGGFGTVAEVFTYLAMKSHGQATEPLLFGSHDDFFKKFNGAFEPFMNEREKPDLKNVYTDTRQLVSEMKKMKPAATPIDSSQVTPRMRDDLEKGLTRLDGKPKAVAFFAGMGARTQATLSTIEEIAKGVSDAGKAVRVSGSPLADDAVMRGVQKSSKPDSEIQAFALEDAPVKDHDQLQYTKVNDVLVIRELMNTNIGAIVTTPEGAKQIALLFTAACDVQTGKMPKIPIVVLDPDGKFGELKKTLGELMLSPERRYINPEDLEMFTITNDPKVALAALNAPPAVAAPPDPMAPFKKQAAEAAVNGHVKSGMKLGIGTGSTMKFAIDMLGAKVQSGELRNIVGVSTSERTTKQATELKIPLSDLKATPKLDLAIDGADEVAKMGNQFALIKGMGGALLREKDVASHAKKFVVVVDDSKLVQKLGTKSPLPVEVDQKAWETVANTLTGLGGEPALRKDKDSGKPYVTDNGNYIVDVKWPKGIDNPQQLAKTLDGTAGVKAHGLFLGMADQVIVASQKGIKTINKTEEIPPELLVKPAAAADATRPAAELTSKLAEAAQGMPPMVKKWIEETLTKQAAVVDASLVMQRARERVTKGETQLPPLDRANLPQTEDQAVELTMNRLGLTAAEKATVQKGMQALLEGGLPPASFREPIGGHSTKYGETFRTQMAITDPGMDHLGMTLADPKLLDGNFVHMEIIDRDTEHMAPYSNPGFKTLAMVRMLLGNDAPSTAFFGRPNYIASTLQDTVPGLDTASAGIKYNLPTAANWMSNAARSVLNMGYSEAKFGMDGLSPDEVKTLGKAVHAQANLQEGEYISAAFNLNAVLKDFGLVPADAPQISGAPTNEQRGLMLKGALESIDAAKEGGFKKVTVDSASMKPPSYPLIEYFSVENLLTWAHHAHETGLETYGSGGMRDYHFPLLQFVGLDGVGVGFSIHEAPKAETPGKAGRLTPEKVASEVELRNAAEKAPVGRLSVMLRMLDERASDGSIDPRQRALRDEAFSFMKNLAHGIDAKLDELKSARDSATAAAAKLPDAEKKAAADAAKKTFEDGFKALIQSSLNDPNNASAAGALLRQGESVGVAA